MEKLAYILRDESSFPRAAADGLLLNEFACFQASLAGLRTAPTENYSHPKGKGGIFLRADADFDPFELTKALSTATRKNALLSTLTGEVLGYLTDGEHTVCPLTDAAEEIPRILVRRSRRITPQNYAEIFRERQESVRNRFCDAGVFFESEDVTLSPLYTIEKGTFITRGTRITGRGQIGKNCTLMGSLLHNVRLEDNVSVKNSVLSDCTVETGTTVGPFAYLRPDTHIGKGARIGDFVEIKNSRIGDGTKVSHLTYVGDSDVGKDVNFGCGTVTSNYDGSKKYRTVIEDHAFIGCNTNLIAPVTVGKNAYVAAGSTVTDQVPEASLAIARARQTNKEDWVKKNKPELIK